MEGAWASRKNLSELQLRRSQLAKCQVVLTKLRGASSSAPPLAGAQRRDGGGGGGLRLITAFGQLAVIVATEGVSHLPAATARCSAPPHRRPSCPSPALEPGHVGEAATAAVLAGAFVRVKQKGAYHLRRITAAHLQDDGSLPVLELEVRGHCLLCGRRLPASAGCLWAGWEPEAHRPHRCISPHAPPPLDPAGRGQARQGRGLLGQQPVCRGC